MMRLRELRQRLRIGLSIGSNGAQAELLDRRGMAVGDGRSWATADPEGLFLSLAGAFGGRPGRVAVALLPPLAQSRVVEYPRMRRAELAQVASREGTRHFLGATDAWIAGARWLVPNHPSPAPVLLAGGDEQLVDRIERAAEAAGWRVDCIVPAVSTWIAAAEESKVDLDPGSVELALDGQVTTLLFDKGHLSAIRRRSAARSTPETDAHRSGTKLGQPDVLAARLAARTAGPELLTRAVDETRTSRDRRRTQWLTVAAVTLILIGASMARFAVERELGVVAQHRSQIRPLVDEALITRDGLVRLENGLATLAAVEKSAPLWSPVLAAVADRLPHESHLLSLRGVGDSLALTGRAATAAPVLEALRAAPAWAGVRADAPIRQVASDDGTTAEEWSVAGWIENPVLKLESGDRSAATRAVSGGGAP